LLAAIDKVRVIAHHVGGGFGGKTYGWFYFDAIVIARRVPASQANLRGRRCYPDRWRRISPACPSRRRAAAS
jgi:hypothetical protein